MDTKTPWPRGVQGVFSTTLRDTTVSAERVTGSGVNVQCCLLITHGEIRNKEILQVFRYYQKCNNIEVMK